MLGRRLGFGKRQESRPEQKIRLWAEGEMVEGGAWWSGSECDGFKVVRQALHDEQ